MIENLKDLEKLLKLLRKQGVQDFKMGEIQLKIGDLPRDRISVDDEPFEPAEEFRDFPTGMLSEAQAIHYSQGGTPENDPELMGR